MAWALNRRAAGQVSGRPMGRALGRAEAKVWPVAVAAAARRAVPREAWPLAPRRPARSPPAQRRPAQRRCAQPGRDRQLAAAGRSPIPPAPATARQARHQQRSARWYARCCSPQAPASQPLRAARGRLAFRLAVPQAAVMLQAGWESGPGLGSALASVSALGLLLRLPAPALLCPLAQRRLANPARLARILVRRPHQAATATGAAALWQRASAWVTRGPGRWSGLRCRAHPAPMAGP